MATWPPSAAINFGQGALLATRATQLVLCFSKRCHLISSGQLAYAKIPAQAI